jgi:cell division septal protein FtsQ
MPPNDRLTRRIIHKMLLKKPSFQMGNKQTAWWIISILFSLLTLGFFVSPLMRVTSLTCVTDMGGSCPDYIPPAFSSLNGKLIYMVNVADVRQQIQAVIPEAQAINVTRKWPGTIDIEIVYQYPVANLQIPASSSAFLVGNNKYITDYLESPNPNLPTIIASDAARLSLGDIISDDAISAAIDITARMPTMRTISIISPLEIRAMTQNADRFIFTSNKSIEKQLDALQLIMATTTINTTNLIYDVRFDHPVLKQTW